MAKKTPEELHAIRMANISPHNFKKGQSANPAGRPKGSSVTDRIRKILDDNNGNAADALAKAIIKAALKGDFRFAKEILDRVEGKVTDKLELDGEVKVIKQVLTLAEPPEDWDAGDD